MRSLVISVCRSGGWLAAYWGRAQGAGVEAAVLSCCLVRHIRKSAWPKSERTFCWSFPRALRSVYGDEQFSGLPWSGYHHNTSYHSCDYRVPSQNKTKIHSAQRHCLMGSQLRSLGLSPGDWRCLGSPGTHRIMQFSQGFWGLFFSVWVIWSILNWSGGVCFIPRKARLSRTR